jgi:hypothetical protein
MTEPVVLPASKADVLLTLMTSLFLGALIVILLREALEKKDEQIIDVTPTTVSDGASPSTV